jgi:hypothetical protein
MNDERLRAVYERILAESRPTGDEATPEQMLALAEGRGSDAERLRTLDRVMRSENSRQDFELLRAAAAAMRPRPRVTTRLWAAAAAVLVIAGASTVTWRQMHQDENVMRGAENAVTLSAPNDSPAASGPLVFAWRRVPGAKSYEVELVEASGTLVQMTTVHDTTWAPPPSVHLVPGVEYRWWVRATLADGTTLEAPPRRLVLSP